MTNFDVELYASQVDLTLESGDNKVIVIRGASGTKIYKDVKKVTGQKNFWSDDKIVFEYSGWNGFEEIDLTPDTIMNGVKVSDFLE